MRGVLCAVTPAQAGVHGAAVVLWFSLTGKRGHSPFLLDVFSERFFDIGEGDVYFWVS